jgi:hypothetical protein
MKTYQLMIDNLRPFLESIKHSMEHYHFKIHRSENDAFSYDFDRNDDFLHICRNHGELTLASMYMHYKLLEEGPKFLELNDDYAAAFINTDINIKLSDYSQPFSTMFVVLPKGFSEAFEVPAFKESKMHRPTMVQVHHDPDVRALFISVHFDTGERVTSLLIKDEELDRSVENVLPHEYQDSVGINQEERHTTRLAIRIALNALLLADNNLVSKGPYNKDHYDRLKTYVKRARDPLKAASSELECKMHPFVYSFEQHVQTYTITRNNEDSSDGSTSKKPHWRRGHYRMQRIGEGLIDQKRVRIAPILINADKFMGQIMDAKAIYLLNSPIRHGGDLQAAAALD